VTWFVWPARSGTVPFLHEAFPECGQGNWQFAIETVEISAAQPASPHALIELPATILPQK
jgi:hypothetical protein